MRSVLSVSLPEKLASDLEDYARKTGRKKSDIVKESVSLYLWDVRSERSESSLVSRLRTKSNKQV